VEMCICWLAAMCGEMIHEHCERAFEGKRVINLCVPCTYLLANVALTFFWELDYFCVTNEGNGESI
jgi:hypothetical protein